VSGKFRKYMGKGRKKAPGEETLGGLWVRDQTRSPSEKLFAIQKNSTAGENLLVNARF
jgi:hypothetical protein